MFAALRYICRSKNFVHERIFAADVESTLETHQPVATLKSGNGQETSGQGLLGTSCLDSEILYFCVPPAILGFRGPDVSARHP